MNDIQDNQIAITLTVNGETVKRIVEPRTSLADFLREDLELTGTHVGCEHGVCGACSVRLDGRVVRGCLVFAVQAGGCSVETIEGLTESGEIADLQEAFQKHNALQCGYCTSGLLMTAAEYLQESAGQDRAAIREFISGNYCRCTGYHAITDAIEAVVKARHGDAKT